MIIRGHEVDLTDAALCFALPDGSVHAATLKELDAWRSAREAEQFGLDLGPEEWNLFGDLPRGFDDDLACLAHGLDWLFELCSVAMGHGVKRTARLEDSGIVQTNYVGPPLAPFNRFFAECLQIQFSTVTGEPASLFLHVPHLAKEFMQDARRTTTGSGAVPHDAVSLVLENINELLLGQRLADDIAAWIPKLPALLEADGSVREEMLAPCRSLAQVVAYADMEGLL